MSADTTPGSPYTDDFDTEILALQARRHPDDAVGGTMRFGYRMEGGSWLDNLKIAQWFRMRCIMKAVDRRLVMMPKILYSAVNTFDDDDAKWIELMLYGPARDMHAFYCWVEEYFKA